jgi:hypothetical protein
LPLALEKYCSEICHKWEKSLPGGKDHFRSVTGLPISECCCSREHLTALAHRSISYRCLMLLVPVPTVPILGAFVVISWHWHLQKPASWCICRMVTAAVSGGCWPAAAATFSAVWYLADLASSSSR